MAIPVIESIAEDAEVDVADGASTLASPSGLATGNWLFPIVAVEADDEAASPFDDSSNKPTGCDLIASFGLGENTDVWGAAYRRLITGGESFPLAVAFNVAAAMVDFCGITLRASGVNDANPVNATGTPINLTSADDKIVTSINTAEDDCLGVAVMIFDGADCSPVSLDAGSISAGWSILAEHTVNTGAVGLTVVIATKDQADAGALGDCTFVPTVSDGATAYMFAIEGSSGSTPALTDVDTDEIIEAGQQDVPFTTTGFSGEINSFVLVSGPYSTTNMFDSGSAGSYLADIVDPTAFVADTAWCPFTTESHDVVARASDGSGTADIAITYNPPAGWVVVETLNATADVGTVLANYSGGAVSDGSQIIIPDDPNITVLPNAQVFTNDDFSGLIWDIDTGMMVPFTFDVVIDDTPDQFTFTDIAGADPETLTTSTPITVAGLDDGVSVDITVDAGMYSINGGAFTADPGTVENDDEVRVQIESSTDYETAVSVTVDIGGVTDVFTVTTRAADVTPDGFAGSFQDIVDVVPESIVTTVPVLISGFDQAVDIPVSISVADGLPAGEWSVSVDGGNTYSAWSDTPGTFQAGASPVYLRVRAQAHPDYDVTYTVGVSVGGASDSFTIKSESAGNVISIGDDDTISPGETATIVVDPEYDTSIIKQIVLKAINGDEYEIKYRGSLTVKVPNHVPEGQYYLVVRQAVAA